MAWQLHGTTPDAGGGAATASTGPGSGGGSARTAAGTAATSICGVADVARYSALAEAEAAPVVQTLADDVSGGTGTVPHALVAQDDALVALALGTDDAATFTSWGADGDVRDTFTVPAADGSDTFALAPDGDVLTTAGTRDGTSVRRYSPAGDVERTYDLAGIDRGSVVAVVGWTAGDRDTVASVAFDGSDQLALLGADGTVDPRGPTLERDEYPAFFPQDDGTLFVLSDSDTDAISLRRYGTDGALLTRFDGTLRETSSNGRAQSLDHPRGIAPGPDGGFLLAGPTWRLVEVDDTGVRGRIALAGEASSGPVLHLADLSPFVRHGDTYSWFSSEDGAVALEQVDVAGMEQLLAAPLTWDINHASTVDRLGVGAGVVTDAPYDYFPAGRTPEVLVELEPWWGAAAAERYELRYRVSGDPWAEPPVTATSGTLTIPAEGGRLPLTLPETRPGPYDVHVEVVERASGTVRTATCLHYAVGAPGSTFDPGALADGADWGGAGPLRSVQIADQLGIGSSRVQLGFGDLVPDVGAEPSVAHLDLDALPGAADGDPFAGIRPAARLAAARGVQLYVQVGQGGEAEHQAVDDGTWGAWVTAIASAFATGAPDMHLWAPWNEPNNTGFGDGGDYARDVLAPFARAVRGVDDQAKVIGGNALNLVVPWYRQVVEAGGCASLDVVGIHPYTGYNRSWDEEGADGPIGQLAELADVLAGCGDEAPPVWDTESGWWSDGPGNHWAQGYDVARTLLWTRALGVPQWTYFFSEGGWGEGGFSWSLLQIDSFVKPGALAMATVSALLEGRPPPEVVETTAPATHVMHVGARAGGTDDLVAVWTDDLVTSLELTADADATVRVTDVYGATRDLDAVAGEPIPLPVSGAPVFLTAASGVHLDVTPSEPTGADVLAGGTASASSTWEGTDPADVLRVGGAGTNPWRADVRRPDGTLDLTPWLQVDLAAPTTIDRVVVESAGLRCCTSALRDYTVQVQTADGAWHDAGSRTDLFHERTSEVRFDPVEVVAVRVQVPSTRERGVEVPRLNYSGQTAGLHPAWSPVVPDTSWPASVVSLAAYAPGPP